MNIVDIIILLALGLAVYKGYNKGLMASLAGLAAYFAGLLAAVLFSGTLARWLDSSFGLTKSITPWLAGQLAIPTSAGATRISQVPFDKAVNMINDYDIPEVFKKIMLGYIDEVSKLPVTRGIDNLGEALTYLVASFILSALAFLLIYWITSKIIGKVIPRFLKKVSPRPVNALDHLGGAAMGAAGTTLTIAVSLAVFMPVLSIGLLKPRGSVLAALAVLLQNSKLATLFMQGMVQLIY